MREQYSTQKVRDYLKQIDVLQDEIWERQENLKRYKTRLENADLANDETARQNLAAMNNDIIRLGTIQDDIIHQISRLDDPAERKCLTRRFVDGMPNDIVAAATGYSESYVRLTIRNAYRHFYAANMTTIDDWYEDRYERV